MLIPVSVLSRLVHVKFNQRFILHEAGSVGDVVLGRSCGRTRINPAPPVAEVRGQLVLRRAVARRIRRMYLANRGMLGIQANRSP